MKQKVINPSNGELIAEIPVSSEQEIESAISAARSAFDNGPWPKLSLAERKAFLLKISQGILDKAAELADLETKNTGKPIKESTFMDIPSSAKVFEHVANNLEKYLKEEFPVLEADAESALIREPLGVIALIVPWNYPLLIASWKLASALGAGNTVVLKPSSLTPLTAIELGKIADLAGLPKGTVNIINGSGEGIGKKLCSDKRVDMVSFTGSNEVGVKITGYISDNPKKTIMELGGKSASIVMPDVDLEVAVNSSLCSIFLNQGQMCTAMSRLLVHKDIYDAFLASFIDKAKRIKIGPGNDFETQIGPLISDSQRRKFLDYCQIAKKEGARIICGGKIPDNQSLSQGFFVEPAVIVDVNPQMRIFQEEVFGPVVCVSKFSTVEEAIELANKVDFGLAACIWSKDTVKAKEIASSLCAGTVWINTYGMFYDELPYGGFKKSGFGKELGRHGFLEYTRLKNIVVDKTPDSKPLVNYWYGF